MSYIKADSPREQEGKAMKDYPLLDAEEIMHAKTAAEDLLQLRLIDLVTYDLLMQRIQERSGE